MGDLIMTAPALRALKETFDCKITVLTSSSGKLITPYLSEIDEVIVSDLPWMPSAKPLLLSEFDKVISLIRERRFDAVVIFTVYSQSALPADLLSYMAEIPNRLAYCRENPYQLLTHWVPDHEPYEWIAHQVERDLKLVAQVGAFCADDCLKLSLKSTLLHCVTKKLPQVEGSWLVLHPGVSEEKRKYPVNDWIILGQKLQQLFALSILVTGSPAESTLTEEIANGIGGKAYSLAGKLTVGEFIGVIQSAVGVISVNTSTIHIAAATQTPQVVLYALTNPQHTPWRSPFVLLPFSVKKELRSKNPIVSYVGSQCFKDDIPYPSPEKIVRKLEQLLTVKEDFINKNPFSTIIYHENELNFSKHASFE